MRSLVRNALRLADGLLLNLTGVVLIMRSREGTRLSDWLLVINGWAIVLSTVALRRNLGVPVWLGIVLAFVGMASS